MNYFKAKSIADRIFELLSPHCEVIHIAGSIRREKSDVKDIEICCIPKEKFVTTDLFGGGNNIRIPEFKETIDSITAETIKGNVNLGRYVQLILKGGDELALDLFMPEKNDYYRQFAIRTGSAEYSHKIIAGGWMKQGWCGSDLGLREMKDCVQQADKSWKCLRPNGILPPIWKSEQEFFDWIKMPLLPPRLRNV